MTLTPVTLHIFGVRSGICQVSVPEELQNRYKEATGASYRNTEGTLVIYRSSDADPRLRLNDTDIY